MVARTEAVPVVTKWHWMPQDPFGDLRVRYGIKMGLAGLLALFCTQVLRLPHDNWAILTVSRVDERTVRGFHHRKSDHASDRNDRRSHRWHLVGRRLYFYASDLSAPPFPGHRSCQLPIWPSRCTPSPICLFFARSHHAYRRYRWGHGSSTSMANRPRSIGGDFGRNYELASGNKRALAPLRA